MKLRTKFFIIYSLLTIIPMLFLTELGYARFRRFATEQVESYSDNFVKNVENRLNDSLGNLGNILDMLTFNPSTKSNTSITDILEQFRRKGDNYSSYDLLLLNKYCSTIFQNLMLVDDAVNGFYLFDNKARLISSSHNQDSIATDSGNISPNFIKEVNAKYPGYYITTINDNSIFKDKKPSLYIGRSIRDIYTHEYLGYILIDCNPNTLNIEEQIKLEKTAHVSVVNSDTGEVLYSNIGDKVADKSYNDNKQSIPLNIKPLTLHIAFNYDRLYDELNPSISLIIAVIAASLIISLIAIYFVTSRLISPIERLSWAISRQGRDELRFVNPYSDRKDEIGTLYFEYADMVNRMNEMVKTRYKDKLILLDSQMKSLEAGINSHFLFNTLESINSMAELENNKNIGTMSLALGNMFRYSIKTQSELVSLKDELGHVNDYISIQNIRFNGKFHFIETIPKELLNTKVLKLILQPLVENSLYHGLEYCTIGDTISLSASEQDGNLVITVSDNGKGMSCDELAKIQSRLSEEPQFTELGHRNNQSIGLKNIHSRIELYYGVEYGLSINSSLNNGTVITIKIPMIS